MAEVTKMRRLYFSRTLFKDSDASAEEDLPLALDRASCTRIPAAHQIRYSLLRQLVKFGLPETDQI